MLLLAGGCVSYLSYRLRGGSSNPDLIKEGTTLYEREAKRVLDWASKQSSGA
jgi:hypothetical protein